MLYKIDYGKRVGNVVARPEHCPHWINPCSHRSGHFTDTGWVCSFEVYFNASFGFVPVGRFPVPSEQQSVARWQWSWRLSWLRIWSTWAWNVAGWTATHFFTKRCARRCSVWPDFSSRFGRVAIMAKRRCVTSKTKYLLRKCKGNVWNPISCYFLLRSGVQYFSVFLPWWRAE